MISLIKLIAFLYETFEFFISKSQYFFLIIFKLLKSISMKDDGSTTSILENKELVSIPTDLSGYFKYCSIFFHSILIFLNIKLILLLLNC